MKGVPSLLLLALLLPLARPDLAAKIRSKDPSVALDSLSQAPAQSPPSSAFDFDALRRLAQPPTPTPTRSSPQYHPEASATHNSQPNLADIVKSRRLAQDALKDPPAVSALSLNRNPTTGIPQLDDALFSAEPLTLRGNPEEAQLKAKISEINNSLSKFRSANLRFLNSIDIEQKNAKLFKEAQTKVTEELENYHRQLQAVREKAAAVKEQKNAAVLELEDLVNKRTDKVRQVAELTRQNDALNAQYAQLEKQNGQIEQASKETEAQIAALKAREDALRKQFDDLNRQLADFRKQKKAARKEAKQSKREKKQLEKQLGKLTSKLQAEAPLNDGLVKQAVDLDQEIAQIEAAALKYQQESSQLDRQLAQLDQMKAAAQRSLADFDTRQKSQDELREQIRTAHEQAARKQAALSDFEHDIKSKERGCRCSRRQLSKVLSQQEMAQRNQEAIQGLMSNIQALNPTTTNMKLLGSIIEPPLAAPLSGQPQGTP